MRYQSMFKQLKGWSRIGSIPFFPYFINDKLRIFITKNLYMGYEWISESKEYFKDTDIFLIRLAWHHDERLLQNSLDLIEHYKLDKSKFIFLFNSPQEIEINKKLNGFEGYYINSNAFIDYDKIDTYIPNTKKLYDAIYVARFNDLKRHYLARKVKNLALVAQNPNQPLIPIDHIPIPPNRTYLNEKCLRHEDTCVKINESKCGIILSKVEGQCKASSEYLLCGIPVVSTKSLGGRDVFYNEDNHIICDDTEDDVASKVEYIVANINKYDPIKIRTQQLVIMNNFRDEFINLLGILFKRYNINDVDPKKYFIDTYIHNLNIKAKQKTNIVNYFKGIPFNE